MVEPEGDCVVYSKVRQFSLESLGSTTPAHLFSNRIKVLGSNPAATQHSNVPFVVANDNQLFFSSFPSFADEGVLTRLGRTKADGFVERLIPHGGCSLHRLPSSFRSEIQHLTSFQLNERGSCNLLTSTDSSGHGSILRIETNPQNQELLKADQVLSTDCSFSGQKSWASGSVISATNDSISFAICHHSGKFVKIFQDGKLVRHLPTVFPATSFSPIQLTGGSDHFISTEYNQMVLWDTREKKACVQRTTIGNGWIYGHDFLASETTVAMGGQDRTLCSVDIKKNQIRARISNPLKYEIRSVNFCTNNSQSDSPVPTALCFLSGVDSEITCCQSNQGSDKLKSRRNFRGDSRWLGIDYVAASDILIGLAESGKIFSFYGASRMAGNFSPSIKPERTKERIFKRADLSIATTVDLSSSQSPRGSNKRQKLMIEEEK